MSGNKVEDNQSDESIYSYETNVSDESNCSDSFESLGIYNPNNSDSSQSEIAKKKVRHDWKLEKKFHDEKDIDSFFEQEPNWSKDYNNKGSEGTNTFYRCNIVKIKGKPCPAKIFLFKKLDKSTEVHRNSCEHDHESEGVELATKTLEKEVANKIQKLHADGLKRRAILHKIHTDESILIKPSVNQVTFAIRK